MTFKIHPYPEQPHDFPLLDGTMVSIIEAGKVHYIGEVIYPGEVISRKGVLTVRAYENLSPEKKARFGFNGRGILILEPAQYEVVS
ncbi:MAG TPA: hypothetical protein VH186_11920 [Chloroflexia bacterium]|nr:hypothetical protein [Chloroflexia bacterium]